MVPDSVLYIEAKAFLIALCYTQPRTLAMLAALPMFSPQVMPNMVRLSVAAGMGLVAAPMLMPLMTYDSLSAAQIILLIVKEAFIGYTLGFMIAVPFWGFEAVGFFIDNQRGASIAATLNPLTGNDTSPLGILFNQAFIVFFFVAGGFTLMLGLLYDSMRLWPIMDFVPTFRPETVPLLLDQLNRIMRMAVLLGAPAIVAMFLSELGLALVSRFVPQLQVFFLAMPIKSALAVLVLLLYLSTLFDYGLDYINQLREIVPFLDGQWKAVAPGASR